MMPFVKRLVKRWQLRRSEDAATKRLGRILNKSPKSRKALTRMLRKGSFDMPLIVRVKTQVILKDRSRPDMAGKDSTGAEALLVESKFRARLRRRQASRYLRHTTTALLFIAPGARVEKLWKEIVQQIRKDSPKTKLGPTTSANGWRSTMVTGAPGRRRAWWTLLIPAWRAKRAKRLLALVSWDRLLSKMTDPYVTKEVRKLQRLVKWQERQAVSAGARRGN